MRHFVMTDLVFETEWSQETYGTLGDPRWDCWFNTSLKVQAAVCKCDGCILKSILDLNFRLDIKTDVL